MTTEVENIIREIQYKTAQTVEQIADNIGYSRVHLTKAKKQKYNGKVIELLNSTYKDILHNVTHETKEGNIPEPPTYLQSRHQLKLKNINSVKFYDVDFAAGNVEFVDSPDRPATYEMILPNFPDCIAFRINGDSMHNVINSGAIVIAKKFNDFKDYIPYGEKFGIVTIDGTRFCKYIRKSTKPETHISLVSANHLYDPFDFPLNKIKSLWLIRGSLNEFL